MYSPSGSGSSTDSSFVELLFDSDQGPVISDTCNSQIPEEPQLVGEGLEEIRDEITRTCKEGDKLNVKDQETRKGNPEFKNLDTSNQPGGNNNGQSAFQPFVHPTGTPFGQPPFIQEFDQQPLPPFFMCNNYSICLLPVLVPNPMGFIQVLQDPGVFVPQENVAPKAPPTTAGSSPPEDPNLNQEQHPCSRVNTPSEICDSLLDFCVEHMDGNNYTEGASDQVDFSNSSATSDGIIVEALQNSEAEITSAENLQGNCHEQETDIRGLQFHGPSQYSIQNMDMMECEDTCSEDISEDFEEINSNNCLNTNSAPLMDQDEPLEVSVTAGFNSPEIQGESTEWELEEAPSVSPQEGTMQKTSHLIPKQITIRKLKHVRISPMDPSKSVATSMPVSVEFTSQGTSVRSDPDVVDANKENVPIKLMLVSAELAKAVTNSVVLPPNNNKLLRGSKKASAGRDIGKKQGLKSKRVKKAPVRFQNDFIQPPTGPPAKRRRGRPSKKSPVARPHSSNSGTKSRTLRPSTSAQKFNTNKFTGDSDSESGLTDDEKKVLVTIEYQ